MPLNRVREYLRSRIGLDPGSTGPSLVAAAVRSRTRALRLTGPEADSYYDLLAGSELEFQALVDEVVVSESWFFRDEAPFAHLKDVAARAMLADPSRPPFRVLCVPCAGGEEPYSVAIGLIESGLAPTRFRVDAVDLSRRALAQAGSAVFSENAFRSADLAFRDRYFQRTENGFALEPAVAKLVHFQHANFTDSHALVLAEPFDVVFCRNLLIYLDAPARDRVLANVDRLLSAGGLLFVGHAESLVVDRPAYRPSGPKAAFAFVHVERDATPAAIAPAPVQPVLKTPKSLQDKRDVAQPPPAGSGQPGAAVPQIPTGKPLSRPAQESPGRPPARTVAPAAPTSSASRRDERLAEASRLADEGRYEAASVVCHEVNTRYGPTAGAYFLLGLIRQAEGEAVQSEVCFAKTVYLDAGHEGALTALANLARSRGDAVAEGRYRVRAERAARENASP